MVQCTEYCFAYLIRLCTKEEYTSLSYQSIPKAMGYVFVFYKEIFQQTNWQTMQYTCNIIVWCTHVTFIAIEMQVLYCWHICCCEQYNKYLKYLNGNATMYSIHCYVMCFTNNRKQTHLSLYVKHNIFWPVLAKFGFRWQNLIKVPNTKFHGNLSIRSRASACRDRHKEAIRFFLQLCEYT
jgi:hypothetical protein